MSTTIVERTLAATIAVALVFTIMIGPQSEVKGAPPKADFVVKGETGWPSKACYYFTTRGDFRDVGIIGWIEDFTTEDGTGWSRYWFNGVAGDFETAWLPFLPEEGREYFFEPPDATGPYQGCSITATAHIEWTWVWWVDADNVRKKLAVPAVHWTMEGHDAS